MPDSWGSGHQSRRFIPGGGGKKPAQVTLSRDFFEEIVHHPVPLDFRALSALKGSAFALDLYTWLTYRLSYLRRPTRITWEQLQWQLGAGYGFDPRGRKNFQQAFTKHLKSVLAVYPAARVEPERGRLLLIPAPAHILPLSTAETKKNETP